MLINAVDGDGLTTLDHLVANTSHKNDITDAWNKTTVLLQAGAAFG